MNMSMILLGLSYLFFMIVLIRVTLTDNLKTRFWVKMLTCVHYLIVAGWGIHEYGLSGSDTWLVIGLSLCFAGDLALGLKHHSQRFMAAGMACFGAGLWAYALYFGFRVEVFWISLPLWVSVGLFILRVKGSPDYDFKGLGPAALAYGLIMTLMVACALGAWVRNPASMSFLRAIGACCLFGSDFILLHLYFYNTKKTGFVLGYLVLYHVGQSLFALSLWV